MTKKRKTPKTKVIYKKVMEKPQFDEDKLKREIKELEESKKDTGKGIRGALRRMAIQKKISDKGKYFGSKTKIQNIRQATQLTNEQVKLEEARARLREFRKKSEVNFEGFGYPQQKKELKIEDIFK